LPACLRSSFFSSLDGGKSYLHLLSFPRRKLVICEEWQKWTSLLPFFLLLIFGNVQLLTCSNKIRQEKLFNFSYFHDTIAISTIHSVSFSGAFHVGMTTFITCLLLFKLFSIFL
jgi:hypothetical protein